MRGREKGYRRDTSSWYPMFWIKEGAANHRRLTAESFAEALQAYNAELIEETKHGRVYHGKTAEGALVVLKRIEDRSKSWTASRSSK